MTGAPDTRLALKVDVDTHDGLARGVPALAALFSAHGVRATFFVVCGPDRMGRRLARLLDPQFVRKLARTRVVKTYGWRTLLSGSLLPARAVAGAHPDLLRRLLADGHEIGVHGHDHARWQDRLPSLSLAQVRAEVQAASGIFRSIVGRAPEGFAAPGWRCTSASLRVVDDAGFAFRSDTRGRSPYRPLVDGRALRAPELPTTWPTLDETIGIVSSSASALADYYVGRLEPGALNVHTIHAEVEGGPHLDVLDALLGRVTACARIVRLGDEAGALDPNVLPTCSVREASIPGRAMPVALQGEPIDRAR